MKVISKIGIIFVLAFSIPLMGQANVDDDCLLSAEPHVAFRSCTRVLMDKDQYSVDDQIKFYLALGAAAIKLKNYKRAVDSANGALALNASESDAYVLRAIAYLNSRNITNAQADASVAVALSPKSAAAHLINAEIFGEMGVTAAAMTSLQTAKGLAADNPEMLERIAAVQDKYAPKPEPTEAVADETDGESAEVAFWSSVKDSKAVEELQAYLDTYPNGVFVALAKIRLKTLGVDSAPSQQNAASQLEVVEVINHALIQNCDELAAHPENSDNPENVPGVEWGAIDFKAAIGACSSALAIFPNHLRSRFNLGRAYHRSDEFERAFEEYKRASDLGYNAAMQNLAVLYQNGTGVSIDELEAFRLINSSAEASDPRGMYLLGQSYNYGWYGATVDKKSATKWYKNSAKLGFADAQFQMGTTYIIRGTTEDIAKGIKWYQKAANQNHTSSIVRLGTVYRDGLWGVGKDIGKAIAYFDKGISLGSSWGKYALAILYEIEPSEYDPAKAAQLHYENLAIGDGELIFGRSSSDFPNWDKQVATKLQVLLKGGGYYTGPIDGDIGPDTEKSMKALCNC